MVGAPPINRNCSRDLATFQLVSDRLSCSIESYRLVVAAVLRSLYSQDEENKVPTDHQHFEISLKFHRSVSKEIVENFTVGHDMDNPPLLCSLTSILGCYV